MIGRDKLIMMTILSESNYTIAEDDLIGNQKLELVVVMNQTFKVALSEQIRVSTLSNLRS